MAVKKILSRAWDLTDGQRIALRRLQSLAHQGETLNRRSLDEGGRQMTGEALSTGTESGIGHNWRIKA